jgi:hypothetical protein
MDVTDLEEHCVMRAGLAELSRHLICPAALIILFALRGSNLRSRVPLYSKKRSRLADIISN